ncbi:hypothetical protein Tco_1383775 [Tanacetum coccineum]
MADQEQNPPKQEQPFVVAKQVGFNPEDIILNTNNKVALLYPKHNNKEHFKCVSDFISKCCLRKTFIRSPNMYKEYLTEFWYTTTTLENSKVFFSTPIGGIYGKVAVNIFRNAIGAHYLPYSSEYVASSSIDILRPWFETIGYGEVVHTRGTLKKSLLPPSLANGINIDYANIFWEDIIIKLKKKHREKPNQPEKPPFTSYMLAICFADKLVAFKAPKPSSNVEWVPQGTKPGAKPRHKKHSTSLKQPSVSTMDSNPIQPPVSTPVDIGMHKKDQQATGDPTSLGVTSEARANLQLSSGMLVFNLNEPIYLASFIIHSEFASRNDASAASIAEADPGIS